MLSSSNDVPGPENEGDRGFDTKAPQIRVPGVWVRGVRPILALSFMYPTYRH